MVKIALLPLFSAVACSIGWATEFPLEAKGMADPNDATILIGWGDSQTKRPTSLKNEPATDSIQPLYGIIKPTYGKERILFRIDPNRLIVDSNGNGDLTDDAVHVRKWLRQGRFDYVCGPIEMSVTSTPISAYARIDSSIWHGGVSLFVGSYFETTVSLDGVQERIALLDGNGNLRLGDPARPLSGFASRDYPSDIWTGEFLLRDPRQTGRFAFDRLFPENEPFGSIAYFDARPYTIAVTDDAKALRIEPCQGPLGVIANRDGAISRLAVAREFNGRWDWFVIHFRDGRAQAPPATYTLYSCVLQVQDAAGETWTAVGQKRRGRDKIEVKEGQTTNPPFGPPLQLRLAGRIRKGRGPSAAKNYASIRVGIFGSAGEEYINFERNGRAATPVRFRILDDKDKEILAGPLRYAGAREDLRLLEIGLFEFEGESRSPAPYLWEIPPAYTGKGLRVIGELDLGPIRATSKPVEIRP